MQEDRHLLSNHADIEAIINNASEHVQHVESFRGEQKICLKRADDFWGALKIFRRENGGWLKFLKAEKGSSHFFRCH